MRQASVPIPMVCPLFAEKSARIKITRSAARIDVTDVFVVGTQTRGQDGGNTGKKETIRAKGTYADLLANLLIYDDVDERSGYCHAVLAGHQIFKGHLR